MFEPWAQLEDSVDSCVVAADAPEVAVLDHGVWVVLRLVVVLLDGVQVKPHTAGGVGDQ